MGFNNKLYQLRKQKGLSQEELANRLNVSRQTVSKWETGDSTPDMEKLITISDFFEISLDELVKGKKSDLENRNSSKSEVLNVLNEKLLTKDNKKKVKYGVKLAAIIFLVIVIIDIISMLVYFSLYGFPS